MKLRITALLATVALIVAIIAFLRDWRQSLVTNDFATPPAVPEKASSVPPSQVIPDDGTKPPAASPGPPAAQAKLPGNSTMVAMPREQSGRAAAPVPMPRIATATVAVATTSTPIPRARMSPADPLAADADRKAGTIEADKVSLMLRDYRTRMGENPFGTNAEIMKSVMGGNPKGALLGPPEGQKLNGEGELVDRWGKPYFFHQLSRTSMEIRSAGPDQQMYTEDDVIVH